MRSVRDLLFLAHRIPYPPDKGDKIRSWNFLSYLSERYSVHLGCFVDDSHDWRRRHELMERCTSCYFARLRPVLAALHGATGLIDGAPLTPRHYRSPGLREWVDGLFARRPPDRVLVFSSALASYVMGPRRGVTRRIIDFVDIDSDKWRQYATTKPWPASWVYRRESRKLLDFERRVATAFDASLFVSANEAALFRRLAPESAHKVFHVGNGVDSEYFSPDRHYEDPFGGQKDILVFTGAMDYWPNVDAVCWFANHVLPRIRDRVPAARIVIVGSNPSSVVRRLARLAGVTVTGRVADTRPYLAHAAAVVAPLRVSRGVQNKVLEAMAMAKSVIVTPCALEGISAEPGRDVVMATADDAFVEKTTEILLGKGPHAIGTNARARVLDDYRWPASLARLEALIEGAVADEDSIGTGSTQLRAVGKP